MKECINDFRSYFFHNGLDFSCELASPKKHYKPQINKVGIKLWESFTCLCILEQSGIEIFPVCLCYIFDEWIYFYIRSKPMHVMPSAVCVFVQVQSWKVLH